MKKLIITLCAITLIGVVFAQAQQSTKNESDPMVPVDNSVGVNTFTSNFIQSNQDNDALRNTGGSRNGTGCDDFNVANTSTIAGWTEQSGGDWQIFNQMLKTPGTYESIWEYITMDGSMQTDGCITGRAIYGSNVEVQFIGLIGRYASQNSNIMFKIQDNTEAGRWDSYYIYVNGGLELYNLGEDFGTDAIIQMEYSGTDVTVRIDIDRDGTWDHTDAATVANTSSGLCGISSYANAYADDYCCGAQCGPLISTPVSNIALYLALILMVGFIAVKAFRIV